MKRILFDRSIFHGDKFELLRSSNLTSDVRKGKFRVFLTPMFVEETLMHALNDKAQFSEHWDFIISLIGQKWFKMAEEIVAIELGYRIRGSNYYFQPRARVRRTIKNVNYFVANSLTQKEHDQIMTEIKNNKETWKQFRQKRLELRKTVKPGTYDLSSYFESNVEWYIENGLMAFHSNSANFLETWRRHRAQCIFTEHFIRAWFATSLLPVRDHSLKVDENDRSDAEQLAFLVWADMIVSDDSHFMKEAFNILYPNSPKGFVSLSEFLEGNTRAANAANNDSGDVRDT